MLRLSQRYSRFIWSLPFGLSVRRTRTFPLISNRQFSNVIKDKIKETILLRKKYIWATVGSTLLFSLWILQKPRIHTDASNNQVLLEIQKDKYTVEQVAEHNSLEKRVWIIHGDGVYDITDFIPMHPGGQQHIMKAAGKFIDPFWNVFTVHHQEHVYEILNKYRIGDLDLSSIPQDENQDSKEQDILIDPFDTDPVRPDWFIVHSDRPYNAEPPAEKLWSDGHVTSNENFYIRNHFPVPYLPDDTHKLMIEIPSRFVISKKNKEELTNSKGPDVASQSNSVNNHVISFTVADLKTRFPHHVVSATMQCAGNRRSDITKQTEQSTQGLQWKPGAIANAEWTGVFLTDVLKASSVDLTSIQSSLSASTKITKGMDIPKHIVFHGAEGYFVSIPIEKAVNPMGDVLLAFEMNHRPIPHDHGFPLRVIVPGYVAARSVKWLSKITFSGQECDSVWQRNDYRMVPSWTSVKDLEREYKKAVSIQDMPIQSAMLVNTTEYDRIPVQRGTRSLNLGGFAYSGGGRGIQRVDVSMDGGKTWTCAEILDASTTNPNTSENNTLSGRKWDWSLWKTRITLPEDEKDWEGVEIVCRAIDTSNNVQPDEHAYNHRGLLGNGWHRLKLTVE